MFSGMISGKYNSSAVVKNKNKVKYRSVYLVMDAERNLLGFEANYYANIEIAVIDVIKYLKLKKLDQDYVLKFNSSKIVINLDSDVESIVENYLKNFRNDVYNIKI